MKIKYLLKSSPEVADCSRDSRIVSLFGFFQCNPSIRVNGNSDMGITLFRSESAQKIGSFSDPGPNGLGSWIPGLNHDYFLY